MTTTINSTTNGEFIVESGVVPLHDRFWDKVSRGVWEAETFLAIDSHTDSKTLAIDCGAWIGPTAFSMAQRAGLCLAFEPDPMAFSTLFANQRLNAGAPWINRLKIFNEGIHSSGAPIQFGGTGGDSMTSALNSDNAENSWTVKTRRLQDVLAEYRAGFKKVFIKIDVEGGEYDIVPSIAEILADKNVSALISFHHRRMKLSFERKHEKPAQAAEEIAATLGRIIAALPWKRKIRTLDGTLLQREAVEQGAALGRSFGAELLID